MITKITGYLFLLIVVLSLTSCHKSSTSSPSFTTPYFPPLTGSTWETVNPADLGWDVTQLNNTISYVASNNSTAFIILYKGRIVSENYWSSWTNTTSAKIFSATKSMVSFIAGLAQEQGKLDITKKASDYLGTGWSKATLAQENLITVKHLLTMTSGLNEDLTYQADAGTSWYYNTTAYQEVISILEMVYNMSLTDLTNTQLWSVIGMQNSSWTTDPEGLTISCSGRDMARFGLLVASNGQWNGTTVMTDANYFQAMTSTSQTINPSYGYLWWLNGKGSYILPSSSPTTDVSVSGALIPSAPTDLVSALGSNDKKIYISSSKDVVVIRHGSQSNASSTQALSAFDNEIWSRLSLAIK